MMDLVLRLREARRLKGLSQKDVARQTGIGEKTISSFETGMRIHSLKVDQLEKLATAYGMTLEQLMSAEFEAFIEGRRLVQAKSGIDRLLSAIAELPDERQDRLLHSFLDMAQMARQSEARGKRLV